MAKPALKPHEHEEGTSARATDQAHTAASAMANAEEMCRTTGARLTPIRRKVLEALYATHKPLGAYDLAEMLGPKGRRLAPITVYRALDFLIEQGLVHRLASQNAYIACAHQHPAGEAVAFLICENCGAVDEVTSPALTKTLGDVLQREKFTARGQILEITGQCGQCSGGAR
ncbi:MAG TPA: Fur family transcriptional regulator [Microvirga sp.]|nr:Fur family transcriptional regulator [Microvirga sp.]